MAETPEEQWSTTGVICPHCLHLHVDDLYDLSEDDNEVTCEICDRDFTVTLHISYTYTSYAPPTAAPPEKPWAIASSSSR